MRLAAGALLAAASGACLAADPRWYLQVDNDVAFATDRWYTSGVRIAREAGGLEIGVLQEVYTPEGLAWIDNTRFKDVLLRHLPGLADTGLANVDNAFEPWDLGRLDPERHPLRAWDKKRKDPWEGDAPHLR